MAHLTYSIYLRPGKKAWDAICPYHPIKLRQNESMFQNLDSPRHHTQPWCRYGLLLGTYWEPRWHQNPPLDHVACRHYHLDCCYPGRYSSPWEQKFVQIHTDISVNKRSILKPEMILTPGIITRVFNEWSLLCSGIDTKCWSASGPRVRTNSVSTLIEVRLDTTFGRHRDTQSSICIWEPGLLSRLKGKDSESVRYRIHKLHQKLQPMSKVVKCPQNRQ